ncbi:MAG: hypothetical protein WD032_11630 [Nitrospirales bacterium]
MSQLIEEEGVLERLTGMAMEAATQGKWDSVSQLYDRRARIGGLGSVSQKVATKLIQHDQWILTRIREVQTLIQHQLREAQQHRRSLEGLKRQWVTHQPPQIQYRLTI